MCNTAFFILSNVISEIERKEGLMHLFFCQCCYVHEYHVIFLSAVFAISSLLHPSQFTRYIWPKPSASRSFVQPFAILCRKSIATVSLSPSTLCSSRSLNRQEVALFN